MPDGTAGSFGDDDRIFSGKDEIGDDAGNQSSVILPINANTCNVSSGRAGSGQLVLGSAARQHRAGRVAIIGGVPSHGRVERTGSPAQSVAGSVGQGNSRNVGPTTDHTPVDSH